MTQTPDIRFPCAMVSGVPVVATPEEIDTTNAGDLRAALLDRYEHGHTKLVVDMSRTQFCDTAGLHALVDAHKRALAQGGEMRVVISGAVIQRIFALTGLDQAIPNFPTVREALLLTRGREVVFFLGKCQVKSQTISPLSSWRAHVGRRIGAAGYRSRTGAALARRARRRPGRHG